MAIEEKRTKYEFKTVEQTEWLWTDLYSILQALKGKEIKVFDLADDELRAISFTWDLELDGRYISPLLKAWEDETITDAEIASYLFLNYGTKWNRMYDALEVDYEPIENYNMVEQEGVIASKTTNGLHGNTTEQQVYAFDSSEPSDQAKTTDTSSINDNENNNTNRTLTRHGNIGVTTSQQMIESEIELRKKILLESVRDDIVNELCLAIFEM